MSKTLKDEVISASKWSALAEIASKLISPLTFLLLARILTPEDFGIAAIALMVIVFSQVFSEAGLNKAIIHRENFILKASYTAFWLNLGLSIVIYLLLYLLSTPIAILFKDIRAADVIKVQGLQVIIMAFSMVQTALLQKELNFKLLFWVRLITTTIPGLVSLVLAHYGLGYWALIFSSIAASTFQGIFLWLLFSWRPKVYFNWQIAREMIAYSKWVIGEGLIAWFYNWADSFIIGHYLTSNALGLYRTGNVLITTVYSLLFSFIMPVLFSAFSKLQQDNQQFKALFILSTKLVFLIAVPVGILFFTSSEFIASILFGEKWKGIEKVIMILGLSHGLSWTISTNAEVYRSKGRADLITKITGLGFLYYLPVYIFFAQIGLTPFLWSRLALVIFTMPIYFFVTKKYFGFSIINIFVELKYTLIGSILMGIVISVLISFFKIEFFKEVDLKFLFQFILIIGASSIFYFIGLIPYRKFIKEIYLKVIKNA